MVACSLYPVHRHDHHPPSSPGRGANPNKILAACSKCKLYNINCSVQTDTKLPTPFPNRLCTHSVGERRARGRRRRRKRARQSTRPPGHRDSSDASDGGRGSPFHIKQHPVKESGVIAGLTKANRGGAFSLRIPKKREGERGDRIIGGSRLSRLKAPPPTRNWYATRLQ